MPTTKKQPATKVSEGVRRFVVKANFVEAGHVFVTGDSVDVRPSLAWVQRRLKRKQLEVIEETRSADDKE